jgi:hypothetical protein
VTAAPATRRRTAPPQLPGTPDAVVPLVLTVVGIALVIGAWVAVSGEPSFSRQLGYVNLGVAGLVVAGVGQVYFLVSRRRAVRTRIASMGATSEGAPS